MGDKHVTAITRRDVTAFTDKLREPGVVTAEGVSIPHMNTTLSLLSALLGFAVKRNRSAALETVRGYLTEPLFESWLSSLSRYKYLERELGDFPFDFWRLYGR
jgi:hypothetical protein